MKVLSVLMVQVYVVFAGTMLLFTPWVGVMLKASPEQIVAASAAISGVGFT